MLVSVNVDMSNCFSNDLKSKFIQFVPTEFGELTSINNDCSVPAVIPRFIDMVSKEVVAIGVVSTINLSEFLSGTDEMTENPPPNGTVEST